MPGLHGEVTIARDADGVPTITAATDDDAAFGLGFAHAQDRLFQMEVQRRAGEGRLAEMLGGDLVRVDRFIRTLGFPRLAESSFAALSPEGRAPIVF